MPQLAMPILDGAPDVTYYRWRQKIGRLTSDQVTRLKDLKIETRADRDQVESSDRVKMISKVWH
ncbi:hypothetical protein [Lichenibacterium ramalinae]|uniref:Uncharacterized protein n=1 Tax=Lichenibacterium ramalinae TaxID=2316527 RepID=A0A4Q2R5V9_9HYPH|nr:hypothetical protein [Lichenibacterium ramalinae]RYB01946.1 hypothetical protein D3272_23265 [Lichenibacterium ramalinae]